MDFTSLPTNAEAILAMTWQDYKPYFNDLESRTLDASSIDAWLEDWSALAEPDRPPEQVAAAAQCIVESTLAELNSSR